MPHIRIHNRYALAGVVGLVLTFVGCGGGGDQLPTAQVSGKVTFDGKPVTGGTLTFLPQASAGNPTPGKPASGTIQSDGTYELGTYDTDDGAVIGRHTISFSAPAPESSSNDGGHGEASASMYERLKPMKTEVEVESGSNTIDIELTK